MRFYVTACSLKLNLHANRIFDLMFLLNSTRAVVQECVERNLVQCRNDFGAIMTEVLKPFANMFMTIGDTFCKRGKKLITYP